MTADHFDRSTWAQCIVETCSTRVDPWDHNIRCPQHRPPPTDPTSLVLDAELHERVDSVDAALAVLDRYGLQITPRICRDAAFVLAAHARATSP